MHYLRWGELLFMNSCNGKLSLMSLSPGCDAGPQCVPSASGAEVKVQKGNSSSPFLLRPLSGGGDWTPHHLRDLHPQHSADGGREGDCK